MDIKRRQAKVQGKDDNWHVINGPRPSTATEPSKRVQEEMAKIHAIVRKGK